MISTFTATLEYKKSLTDHIYLFRFKPDQPLDFQAGQYVILHIPHGNGAAARRLYSISSPASNKNAFELIVEIVPGGVASEHLMKMQPGEHLTVQGPAGIFTLKETAKDIIFLATGTGIAPIHSMIHQLLENPSPGNKRNILLFWGLASFPQVYLLEELIKFHKNHSNFTFYLCLSRESSLEGVQNKELQEYYQLGRINESFDEHIRDDVTRYQYYVCGGPKIVESLKEFLATKNIPREQVHFEKFTV